MEQINQTNRFEGLATLGEPKPKFKRQAIVVTIKELEELLDEAYSMIPEEIKDIPKKALDFRNNIRIQFSIINKQPECSDTWQFEK